MFIHLYTLLFILYFPLTKIVLYNSYMKLWKDNNIMCKFTDICKGNFSTFSHTMSHLQYHFRLYKAIHIMPFT